MGLFKKRKYKGFKRGAYSRGYVKTGGGHKNRGFLKGIFKKKNKNHIGGSSSNGDVAVKTPRHPSPSGMIWDLSPNKNMGIPASNK